MKKYLFFCFLILLLTNCAIADSIILYDAELSDQIPSEQSSAWNYASTNNGSAYFINDGQDKFTRIDTNESISDNAYFITSSSPGLSRTLGYTVNARIRINEMHPSSNVHRGAIDLFTTSDEDNMGIMVRIRDGGIVINDNNWTTIQSVYFGAGETDTSEFVDYSLHIEGSTYTLSADNVEILSGSLYTYTLSNRIQIGDSTYGGAGIADLAYVELIRHGIAPIPEPSTIMLILAGIIGLIHKKTKS